MQHLCMCLPVKIEEYPFGYLAHACQAWVRFFALRRIKPHAPPLVRTPVNSFEFQSCDRSPQAVYLMGYRRHRWNEPPTPSIHSLQLGLPGYLIQFAPLAFAPQCQLQARNPPSPRVFFAISTHFTATPQIPISLPALKPFSIKCNCTVKQYDFTSDLNGHLQALYAQ